MIQVGINSQVFLKNAQLDDKNWLTITFGQVSDKVYNAYEALMAENEVVRDESGDVSIKIFDPKVPKDVDTKGNTVTAEQKQKRIIGDINKAKEVLIHLLKGYLTKEQIKFDMYRGTGIDADNFHQRIMEQSVLTMIHKNVCLDFINMAKEFFGNEEQLFRLLLVRTSKDKHFATFRTNYVEDNPFWESMDIPAEASKLKFTPYEIKEGLNDGTPTSRSEADKPIDQTPVTAETIFGQ